MVKKATGKQNPIKAARAVGPILGAMMGLPAQVRLAAREQQQRPMPFVPPKGKRRGR
jgi:hypothetical protein